MVKVEAYLQGIWVGFDRGSRKALAGSLILFYLTDQLSLVHLLQSVHHLLPLCDLLHCILREAFGRGKSIACIFHPLMGAADVECSHHVLSPDVADHHLEGQTFGMWIFL
jgi:hypothetical protein